MLVMLTRFVRLGFSRERQALYSLPKQVKDVLALRGLSSQTAYFRLEGTKIELPNDSYLHTVSGPSGTQLQFLDTHLNYFHPATPIMRLLVGSFFLKWEGDLYYIMTNEPLIPTPTNPLFELAEGSAQLEGIVGESLREL